MNTVKVTRYNAVYIHLAIFFAPSAFDSISNTFGQLPCKFCFLVQCTKVVDPNALRRANTSIHWNTIRDLCDAESAESSHDSDPSGPPGKSLLFFHDGNKEEGRLAEFIA